MVTLSERRKEKNLKQEDVAKILGVDRSTVSKWETGEFLPSSKLLIAMAAILDCTSDDILLATNSPLKREVAM